MGNLLWGTLALGIIALVALVGYNLWEMRAARARRPRLAEPAAVAAVAGQAALQDERIEPSLDGSAASAQTAATVERGQGILASQPQADAALEEGIASPAPIAPIAHIAHKPAAALGELNELIYAVAEVDFPAPLSGGAIQPLLPGSLRAGSKPVELRGWSISTDDWTALDVHDSYSRLSAGVLLANRAGPINEVEYSDFIAMAQRLAGATSADTDFPDMLDVVAKARTLDEFAAQHDALITITLQARGTPWSAAFLQQAAMGCGFTAGHIPGRMVLPAPDDSALLTLQFDPQAALADEPNAQALSHAALVLDVPAVDATLEPLAALHRASNHLAGKLDAIMVDDGGQLLSDATWTMLHNQLKSLYGALAQRGLPAGAPATRKLYSG
jgi:hypothetical protein